MWIDLWDKVVKTGEYIPFPIPLSGLACAKGSLKMIHFCFQLLKLVCSEDPYGVLKQFTVTVSGPSV